MHLRMLWQNRKRNDLKRRMIYRCSLQEKASHTFHAKKTILSWYGKAKHGMVRMEQCTWCIRWRYTIDAPASLCTAVTVLLCVCVCVHYAVLWYIFHVDIATHKLHIIHRVSVCVCESISAARYTIFTEMLKCDTLVCTIVHNDMAGSLFLSLSLLRPNFHWMFLVFSIFVSVSLSLSLPLLQKLHRVRCSHC